MTTTTLTSHAEKVATLHDFLHFTAQEYYCPAATLTIVGQGGSGKSAVVHEVLKTSPIPIVVIEEDIIRYYPGTTPNADKCAVIYVCLTLTDYKMPEYFRSKILEFKPDPDMRSSYNR